MEFFRFSLGSFDGKFSGQFSGSFAHCWVWFGYKTQWAGLERLCSGRRVGYYFASLCVCYAVLGLVCLVSFSLGRLQPLARNSAS